MQQGVPDSLWDPIQAIVQEVSDEIGEEDLGDGYFLKYEGWGGLCIEHVWLRVLELQERAGLDTESAEAIEAREDACYEYAEKQTDKIIEAVWIPEMKKRGFTYLYGSFDPGGLYGRTWALFGRRKAGKR